MKKVVLVSLLAMSCQKAPVSSLNASDERDIITCTASHADDSGALISESSDVLDLASGTSLHSVIDNVTVDLDLDPATQVATIQMYSTKAQLGGNVKGKLTSGQKLSITTINDYGFGDSSNAELSCNRGAPQEIVTPVLKTVTCTSKNLGNGLILAEKTAQLSYAEASFEEENLSVTTNYLSDARLSMWPNPSDHGGFTVAGSSSREHPLRVSTGDLEYACFAE